MTTLEKQLIQKVFMRVTVLNGEETEAELNMLISEKIVENNLDEMLKDNLISARLEGEPDTEIEIANGVYVYDYKSLMDWNFNKYNTVADAVRAAIKTLNATILCDGKVITYDVIDDKSAYYIDNVNNKMKIVTI